MFVSFVAWVKMLSVRKNLTEILLEVTNEEIHAIAHETLSKMQTKGQKIHIFIDIVFIRFKSYDEYI